MCWTRARPKLRRRTARCIQAESRQLLSPWLTASFFFSGLSTFFLVVPMKAVKKSVHNRCENDPHQN